MYKPPYQSSYGLNNTTTVLLQGWLWYEITHERWHAFKQKKLSIKPNENEKKTKKRKKKETNEKKRND